MEKYEISGIPSLIVVSKTGQVISTNGRSEVTEKGPKAFQRHFAEWRHAHGMRCLGIPNTAHFANVTQIEDAMALWEKLKQQKSEEAFKPDQEEEFEDSQGNVVNKKIYEDLKRQGLL